MILKQCETCLQMFRFLADFRLFFFDHFCESSSTVENFFYPKNLGGGKLARLPRCFFLRHIRFTLKSSTDSEKSQVNECNNIDSRVCTGHTLPGRPRQVKMVSVD